MNIWISRKHSKYVVNIHKYIQKGIFSPSYLPTLTKLCSACPRHWNMKPFLLICKLDFFIEQRFWSKWTVFRYWPIKSIETYVAFPSRKKTQLNVSSNSAELIFRETGFKLSVNDCCVGSTLAYFLILIFADASTRFLPICET